MAQRKITIREILVIKVHQVLVKVMTMMKKNTKKMMTMTMVMMIGGNLYW